MYKYIACSFSHRSSKADPFASILIRGHFDYTLSIISKNVISRDSIPLTIRPNRMSCDFFAGFLFFFQFISTCVRSPGSHHFGPSIYKKEKKKIQYYFFKLQTNEITNVLINIYWRQP